MNTNIQKILRLFKNPKTLVIIGFVGILLIFLSTLSEDKKEITYENENIFSPEEYCERLEEDIKKTVNSITGSRHTTVIVTLENSVQYSYADIKEELSSDKTEQKSESSSREFKGGYITVKTSDGGEEALLITELMPDIRGVAIVCDGGDNEILQQKVQNAVTSALNITSKRVFVCGRKQ